MYVKYAPAFPWFYYYIRLVWYLIIYAMTSVDKV